MHKLIRDALWFKAKLLLSKPTICWITFKTLPTQQPSWSAPKAVGAKFFHLWSCGCLGIVACGKRQCHCCMLLAKDTILIKKWTLNCHQMWMAFASIVAKTCDDPFCQGPSLSHLTPCQSLPQSLSGSELLRLHDLTWSPSNSTE